MFKRLVFVAFLFLTVTALTQQVPVHYWHFNYLGSDNLTTVTPDQSIAGEAFITYPGTGEGYMDRVNDGTDLNALEGVEPGYALRVRNPSSTRQLLLNVPTTGYTNIVLTYAVKRTTNGAQSNSVEYRTSSADQFTPIGTAYIVEPDYSTIEIDFSEVEGVNNNPEFEIRIIFGGDNAPGIDGNNRFDNITISGTPMSGVNVPPQLVQTIPFTELIAGNSNLTFDLNTIFTDPDDDPLTFATTSSRSQVVEASIDGSTLSIAPISQGDAIITVTANDGNHPPVETDFRVLVYPQAHALNQGPYTFEEWNPLTPALTYPDNMIFLQSDISGPVEDTPLLFPYNIPADDYHDDDQASIGFPYNTTRRTRIEGMGDQGISFINTGRDRDLGGALLALNTNGIETAYLNWNCGTVIQNSRVYGITLQYRTSIDQPFTDVLDDEGNPLLYRAKNDGDFEVFPNIPIPEDAKDKPYVQFLWRYYHMSGDSGPRAQISLNRISAHTEVSPYNVIFATICHGDTYTFGERTLSASGNYSETYPTDAGPDSTVVLALMVKRVDINVMVEDGVITANAEGATYQWIDCDNDFDPIDGATGRSFEPTASGSYAVSVTDGECTETSACVFINISSTAINRQDIESNRSTLNIYPNPTSGHFTVKGESDGSYILVNTLGQTLLQFELNSTNGYTKDVSTLNPGVYFVVSRENHQRAERVIVTQ